MGHVANPRTGGLSTVRQRPFNFLRLTPGGNVSATIYGIKNCDTMKKARAWLDANGVAYRFHDYKAAGIERPRLQEWASKVGWQTLLNRAGTTFRKLPDKDKEA